MRSSRTRTFAVSCGGTGGHVFPGLAAARVLRARGHHVTLWLGGKAIEDSIRTAWDGPIADVCSRELDARPLRLPLTLVRFARVYRTSLRVLRERKPDLLLAMGSYSSVGPALAARRLRIPVVLHEANVVPGRAIAWLSRLAHTVAISFPETDRHLRHARLALTGLPLRKDLESAAGEAPAAPAAGFVLLIMGGSQGAVRVNTAAMDAVSRLHAEGRAFRVVHLAGEHEKARVTAAYAAAGVPHTVIGFCRDMVSVYRTAHLAVARAGANSCMELALFGVPALLVPYPEAARNHQLANARAMASAGAADVIEQRDLTPERLADYLRAAMAAPARLDGMRAAARRRALAGADEKLADLVEEVAGGR
jgi:UDP-N-acetylglucosamine--N-acetylmuramyl-(pentapeptide) pyrophosphoryl-undecaprenol N-acetylglucosamine transferase